MNKVGKVLLAVLATALAALAICFLAVAFIVWDMNAGSWSSEARGAVVFLWVVVGLPLAAISAFFAPDSKV